MKLFRLAFFLAYSVYGKIKHHHESKPHHGGCLWNPYQVLQQHPYLIANETREPLQGTVLPEIWDWRNVNGTSFVTRTLNQHIPKYCGSCWAHAAVSSFSDRLKIIRSAQWPEIQVSTQYPLNCLTKAGTCEGGSDLILYSELHKEGAPDDTCESYVAEDKKCSKKNRCRNCFGPPGKGKCFPQESYHKYKAKDFGFMKNDDIPNTEPGRLSMHHNKESPNLHRMIQSMKTEIFNRGPISCVVDADPMFNYTAGDIIDRAGDEINHVISIAGWGKEDGTEYWIGRNSWGTYWGDQGWMRIRMGTNSVFVESFCSWVEPDWPPIEVHEDLSSNVDEPHACSGCSSKSHCPERCMHEDDATPIVV